MIFDCLNEALDGKRVLGLKGCPLPVDLVSVFQAGGARMPEPGSTGRVATLKEAHSRASNTQSQHWKTQLSKSESMMENSMKVSAVKNSISRSLQKNAENEKNKENLGKNSMLGPGLFPAAKRPRDPLASVFEKTAEQIKKWALFMCGMYEHKPENFKYLPEIVNPVILEKIKESRMTLLEMNEMEELGYKMSDFDDEKYEIGLNLNDFIWDHLLEGLCQDFLGGRRALRAESRTTPTASQNCRKTPDRSHTARDPRVSRNQSEVIPTEEAITKLDYFPNYSCTHTERSCEANSRSLIRAGESVSELVKVSSLPVEKSGKQRTSLAEGGLEKCFKINTEIKAKQAKDVPSKIKNIRKIDFKKFEKNEGSKSLGDDADSNNPIEKTSSKIEIVVNKALSKKIKQLKNLNLKPSFGKTGYQNA